MTEAEQELIEGLQRQDPKAQWLTQQHPSKKGKKAQKYVQKLMEKYMEEMNKLVDEPKW